MKDDRKDSCPRRHRRREGQRSRSRCCSARARSRPPDIPATMKSIKEAVTAEAKPQGRTMPRPKGDSGASRHSPPGGAAARGPNRCLRPVIRRASSHRRSPGASPSRRESILPRCPARARAGASSNRMSTVPKPGAGQACSGACRNRATSPQAEAIVRRRAAARRAILLQARMITSKFRTIRCAKRSPSG